MKELKVGDDILDALSDAKVNVAMGSVMMSYMMYKCRFMFTDSLPQKTAAAIVTPNENIIAFDPHFFMVGLRDSKERAFVILHEILHLFLEHPMRGRDNPETNLEVWGEAIDYNVNLTCSGVYGVPDGNDGWRIGGKNARYMKYFKFSEFGGLYDESFVGMSANEIYKELLKNPEKYSGGNGDGSLDEHIVADGDVSKQRTKNIQTMLSAVINAERSKAIGDNEMALAMTIKEMAEPKVDWREYLYDVFKSTGDDHSTYNRCSRRNTGRIVFPTYDGEKIHIVFGVDSSGSMGYNDYARVRGELYGILEQFHSWVVDVVSCDTKAHLLGRFRSEDGETFEDANVEFIGGGGTSMTPIVEYANELFDEGEEINACLILTDGFIPTGIDNKFREDFENIVLVTDSGNKNLSLNNCKVIKIED